MAAAGCGGSNNNNHPAGPSHTPVIRSVSPASGTTFGGTEVTIPGEKFVVGATVTFGGTAGTKEVGEAVASLI